MHALDNVIWQALSTRQAHLGESRNSARRFQPEISLLGGFPVPAEDHYDSLASLVQPGERVGLFLKEDPIELAAWTIALSVPLLEMVCDNGHAPAPQNGGMIVPLGEQNVPEMMSLTQLTLPGPFSARTREMGEYWGIRDDGGELIAMAGERLKVPGYTEVSAVCTHPKHTGKGYARTLILWLMSRIAGRGETSFLHVRPDNKRAVKLYESLGFSNRVLLRYVILQKK